MRADARKNYNRLLTVAREVVAAQGTDASMRDIARRAEVGLATLLRHFPTREALVEALVCTDLNALTAKAGSLEEAEEPGSALRVWLDEWIRFARGYKGVVAMMAAAHSDSASALYAACAAVHSASGRLLALAQATGAARDDMTGDDLFALMTALGWAIDQPSFAPRAGPLVAILADAVMPDCAPKTPSTGD